VSLYLNYLGPKALPLVRHAVTRAAPALRVLNLQFTDLALSASPAKKLPLVPGKASSWGEQGAMLASLRDAAEAAGVSMEM
jgi:hypothetical protein